MPILPRVKMLFELQVSSRSDIVERNALLGTGDDGGECKHESGVETRFRGPRRGVDCGPGKCAADYAGDERALGSINWEQSTGGDLESLR